MSKFKSHKTVEQIARKHRMDVSFIQKQLDIGEPIEHEHTQDHELAKDIALQHLDEIPDYYTRLKKMEADAKKHHKKFKDVKEGNLHRWYQDSQSVDKKPGWVEVISGEPCAREEGEKGTPKCVSSDKRASMTKKERISAQRRKSAADPNQPEKSGAAKPTYVSTDKPEKKMNEQMLPPIDPISHRKQQRIEKATKLQQSSKGTPESGAAGSAIKRLGGSGISLPLADEYVVEVKDKPGKGSGKKDACYNKVKSRYDVWPSAYASGALVKCRKVGAANWGTKSESTMHEEERFCPLCDKRETRSQCSYGEKAWDKVSVKDEEYSMARSELKTIHNALKRLEQKVGKGEGDLEAWVQSKITKAADYIDTAADYVMSGEMEEQKLVDKLMNEILDEKCWSGYKKKGMKTMFGKKYPNCVKAEDVTIEDADGNTFAEVVDLIQPEAIKGFKSQVNEATRLQAQTGNIIGVTLSWRAKYYSMKMFFPQVKLPTRKEINDELQKVYPGSVVIYHSVSELQPGQPLIQACGPQGGSAAKFGPNKNYIKTMGEGIELEEEGPSLSVGRGEKLSVSMGGGLTAKGREKYNRETGSNLQAPVTGDVKPGSKAAKRRKNFCSRSKSWKGERGLAARRRWKCN